MYQVESIGAAMEAKNNEHAVKVLEQELELETLRAFMRTHYEPEAKEVEVVAQPVSLPLNEPEAKKPEAKKVEPEAKKVEVVAQPVSLDAPKEEEQEEKEAAYKKQINNAISSVRFILMRKILNKRT